jgi:hypothetical protein
MPLSRICGTDETGTLYIGAAGKSLFNRLGSLLKTHSPEYLSEPHRVLPARLANSFPPSRLAFAWEWTNKPWDREQELLRAYEDAFGELPPANGQRYGETSTDLSAPADRDEI